MRVNYISLDLLASQNQMKKGKSEIISDDNLDNTKQNMEVTQQQSNYY